MPSSKSRDLDGCHGERNMELRPLVIVFCLLLLEGICQEEDEEDGPYRGRFLGQLAAFSHQIEGDVFAVNKTSLLLRHFYYDGSGRDTYFWAGSSIHQGKSAGFPIPDEEKKTNVLKKYINAEITLILPQNKKVADLRWFAIYDVSSATTFAEVIFPEDFEPPSPRRLPEFTRNAHNVQSDPILVNDSKVLVITDLSYDGKGSDAYFWVGNGPVPNSKGMKIPDENGFLEPLHAYKKKNITLTLPGNMTIFDIDWLSIYNVASKENYGSMLFPNELNVPPSLIKDLSFISKLANCEQLHRKIQLNWQLSSRSITIELAAHIGSHDYMAIGMNAEGSRMINANIIVVSLNDSKATAEEFFITDKTPCFAVPQNTVVTHKGVCPKRHYGEASAIHIHHFQRQEGVAVVNFTVPIKQGGIFDPSVLNSDVYLVWAVGHTGARGEPLYHYICNSGNVRLNYSRLPVMRNCFSFTDQLDQQKKPWGPLKIIERYSFFFNVTLGPSGRNRGYEGITEQPSPGLVWYINDLMSPEIHVKRGQKYTFAISGGNDIRNPAYHHPFYISTDARGGYETLSSQEKQLVEIFAGITFDHKKRAIPLAAGRLCVWQNSSVNPSRWDEFSNFYRFRSTLKLKCEVGEPYILEWTPSSTTPNVVYYQSFRQPHMGWKIIVRDSWRNQATPTKVSFTAIFFCSLALYLLS